ANHAGTVFPVTLQIGAAENRALDRNFFAVPAFINVARTQILVPERKMLQQIRHRMNAQLGKVFRFLRPDGTHCADGELTQIGHDRAGPMKIPIVPGPVWVPITGPMAEKTLFCTAKCSLRTARRLSADDGSL